MTSNPVEKINMRTRLPNRRPSITKQIIFPHAGQNIPVMLTAGLDPASGAVLEVFADAAKEGSLLGTTMSDAAVAISVALQYGAPLSVLTHSMGRVPLEPTRPEDLDGRRDVPTVPASPIGAILDALTEIETTGADLRARWAAAKAKGG